MGLEKNVEDSMDSAKDEQVNGRRTVKARKAERCMREVPHGIFWIRAQKDQGESRKGYSL